MVAILRGRVVFLALMLTAMGCASIQVQDMAPCIPTELPKKKKALPPPKGVSVEGRPLYCSVFGHGTETVLILGGIHGDESAGSVLSKALSDYIIQDHWHLISDRRIVIAPELNPDGLANQQRYNARGVDINRNFDTWNRGSKEQHGPGPLSEPETRYIVALIQRYDPERILTLHQPMACVDWDGPARDLAETVSKACGLPLRKLGARPGSLGSYAGEELGIPTLTLELPKDASDQSPEEVWQRFGWALIKAIRYGS